MATTDLRIALFSGNYNYVRDGANQALNRLVGYLLRQGAKVRVYAPVVEPAAFPRTEGNVFLVRGEFERGIEPWWRPGMTGLCKLAVEPRTLGWIVTHRTVDFLRMFLWW